MTVLGPACPACKAVSPRAARFCIACGFRLADVAAGTGPFRPERPTIERRRITVVFCDLVGSSALATSMDAEDYTELLGTAHRLVTEVVERFGGFVAHYLGDGTLSYFGYPRANEDDSERAVWAALAMADAVSAVAIPDGRRLSVRVGVAAGEVVAGDIVGLGGPRGLDVAGELPNLAARLQGEAEAGMVVVNDAVVRAAGRTFECASLGERHLKGWSDAVPVWRVLRPAMSGGRIGWSDPSRLAPLIGRDSETALLASLWDEARGGRGRAVLLTGEPGIGKSRLAADLAQRTAGQDVARLRYGCSALQKGVPLAPFVREIERTAGLRPDDGPDTKRMKLKAAVGEVGDQALDLIGGLLGLPAMAAAPQVSPQKRRERTIGALIQAAARLAEQRPLLVVFEDAHWSDPSSAELLAALVQEIGTRPILLVVTARPEFDPPWAEHASAEVIELNPLSAVESRELVAWTAGGGDRLTREAVRTIAARCDGVPLFLEEVTKAVLESGAKGTAPHRPYAPSSVPAAIHSSLLARLDRLGEARELAEVAAVIGREFGLELLARVTSQPQAALGPALARSAESGLVAAIPVPGALQFRFKHALIQDAAYGIIVRGQRRALHARVADALEAHFPELAAAEPQLLAHHCTEAGFDEKAAAWWLRAGVQSLMRSAAPEALAQLARGLEAVEALPVARAREQLELDLRLAYAKALIATQGHAAPSTAETFAIARDLCERLGGRPQQFLAALYGQWTYALFRADFHSAQLQAEEILRAADERQDKLWLMVGSYCLGITYLPLGAFDLLRRHLGRGLAAAVGPDGTRHAGPLASDPVVVMRTYLCRALMCMGRLDEARRECAAAVEDARRLGQAFTLAFALCEEAYLALMTASPEAALPTIETLLHLARDHGIAYFETVASMLQGWARAKLGDHAAGIALLREGHEQHVGASNLLYVPSYLRMEAEALGYAGRAEDGLRLLAQGERLKDETGALWDEAEFERTRGELLWSCGRTEEAENAFGRAIRLAQARSARLFELRAALACADRLASVGRWTEARDRLAPICAWFRDEEQGTCSDLVRARLLLDRLGSAAVAAERTREHA